MTKGLFFAEIDRFAQIKIASYTEMTGKLAAAYVRYMHRLGSMWQHNLESLNLDRAEMSCKPSSP